MELVVSNAERRALVNGEKLAVLPRVSDIYAALPGITGKLELEYEGEMNGADTVVRDLIRLAVGKIYDRYFGETNTQQIEQWFNLGGTVKLDDNQSSSAELADLKQIQGLFEKLSPLACQVVGRAAGRGCRGGVSARRAGSASQAEPQRGARVRNARQRPAQAGARHRSGIRRLAEGTAIRTRRWVELKPFSTRNISMRTTTKADPSLRLPHGHDVSMGPQNATFRMTHHLRCDPIRSARFIP